MAKVSISSNDVSGQLRTKVLKALHKHAGLEQLIVKQAKARMRNGGDSTHEYPELWQHPKSYRRNGKPLMDTKTLYNGLKGQIIATGNKIKVALLDTVGYGVDHQEGFSKDGPVPIALTRKAARLMKAGGIKSLDDTDLKEGKDYIIAWDGVEVPQRKIFNTPPENIKALSKNIGRAIKKMR